MKLIERLSDTLWPKAPTRSRKPDEALGARGHVRKRERLSDGFVTSERMIAPRACTLRDLTAFGCRIDIWDDLSPRLLRGGLTLYIIADRKEVDCELKWRRDRAIGLKFTGPFREPNRSYSKR